MAQYTLLLADNDADYLELFRDYFEKRHFEVRTATNSEDAKAILEQGGIDLAILDVRLENNADKQDISGIRILKEAPEVPKILLTQWLTYETHRKANKASLDGKSRPAACVSKKEGLPALLSAVRNTLEFESRYRESSNTLVLKLNEDYEEARRQSRWNYRVGLGVAVLGGAFILAGTYLALIDKTYVAVLSALAGLLAEAATVLFFKRTDLANERMDRYHQELVETRGLEILLDASGELPVGGMREQCRERVINAATALWLGPKPMRSAIPAKRSANQERNHEKETVGRGQ
ncbi:MAG: response regulator [Acidobacteria bacterium]|nr:response regulator [Acidobacteriota bacterium]